VAAEEEGDAEEVEDEQGNVSTSPFRRFQLIDEALG